MILLNNLHADLALFGALFVFCFCSVKDVFNLYVVHIVEDKCLAFYHSCPGFQSPSLSSRPKEGHTSQTVSPLAASLLSEAALHGV